MDKRDLDELNKLEFQQEQEQFEKYGMDLRKVNRKKVSKRSRKLAKFLNRIVRLITTSLFALIIIVGIGLLLFLYIIWANINTNVNVNVTDVLEGTYGIKIKILKQETEGRVDNGKYYIQLKNEPKIKFTAVKWYGSLHEDYIDQITKYYFDLWDSPNKKYFIVNENIDENNLLDYELYVDNYYNIDDATVAFIDFVDFCGNNYKAYWQVYIKVNDNRIYPYTGSTTTREQAIDNVNKMYNEYLNLIGNTN